MKKLENKVALITGGSSGIGLGAAKALAAEGAIVVIVGRNREKLESVKKEINGSVSIIRADASTLEGIGTIIQEMKDVYGRIDILFANAGISDAPSLFATGEIDYHHMMDINVKGVFFIVVKAFPLLSEGAAVILTSSVAHGKGRPGNVLYSMSKAAVRSMGRTFAMDPEILGKKIRVNTLSPGPILTPMVSQDTPEMQEAIGEYIRTTVPMGRWGQPEEAAKAVLFLASDDSSYMTGGEILVDGGLAQV